MQFELNYFFKTRNTAILKSLPIDKDGRSSANYGLLSILDIHRNQLLYGGILQVVAKLLRVKADFYGVFLNLCIIQPSVVLKELVVEFPEQYHTHSILARKSECYVPRIARNFPLLRMELNPFSVRPKPPWIVTRSKFMK